MIDKIPHDWVASPYGHGEWACRYCKATNREIAVFGDPNHCPDRAAVLAPQPALRDETGMEHIARDMREGRFLGRSPRQQVPVEAAPQPARDLIEELPPGTTE